ncbi:MAG: hypothetical protein DRJ33_08635 [Candidatus Methanomethylicota archaeon]|uniref:Alpha-2-macroglobulin bait region domain-containing protein n=1 Tax=Thermoproteota archaeon TaxID=2056631 RepID=A0A497EQR3_9CREN|nr:MAG: hypothetical protein DRJ33_08635 [Candidatus Verstraetearchaeota archaeon]
MNYPKEIGANAVLPIVINASADKVLVQVSVNGVEKNVSATYSNGLFHVNLPVKEGIYKVEKVYAFRGDKSVVKDVNAVLRAFDRPVIYDVIYQHKLKPGEEAIVKVNASDTSGIAKALIEVSGGNVSMVKPANGLHAYNVSLGEDPATLPVKVYVLDPYKQASRASGEIHWLLQDAFGYWSTKII